MAALREIGGRDVEAGGEAGVEGFEVGELVFGAGVDGRVEHDCC